jgi:broad specificity phosphatase PhoE
MSDDLVKRLRGWHDMPADAWFTTMETAADHIEKLEAALREIEAHPEPYLYADEMAIIAYNALNSK